MRTDLMRARIRAAVHSTIAARAELLVITAVLAGWGSLTTGVRALTWGAASRAVWPISTGLLLLSACGWGFIVRVSIVGLYVLRERAKAGKG